MIWTNSFCLYQKTFCVPEQCFQTCLIDQHSTNRAESTQVCLCLTFPFAHTLQDLKLNVARSLACLFSALALTCPTSPGAGDTKQRKVQLSCRFSFWFSYHKEHFLAVLQRLHQKSSQYCKMPLGVVFLGDLETQLLMLCSLFAGSDVLIPDPAVCANRNFPVLMQLR